MKANHRAVKDQVIVITGASSGIGLTTAIMAAERGAHLVLNSRDEADLEAAVQRIRSTGGEAVSVAGDVADEETMRRLGEQAVAAFGRIDTWVNNAGVSAYGRIEEVTLDDARRIFETNYWGVVNGSLAALKHLRREGGALINVGSILSDTGYPLQGHYAASKHAVKGFTDSLRLEVEESGAPVSVTLIQPAAIDTPYPEHARNYLGVEPRHVPPVYAPEVVAEAILHCAVHPERDVLVGGSGKFFAASEKFAPAIFDRMKIATGFQGQHSDVPALDDDTLHAPRSGGARMRGGYPGHVMESSLYTKARLHRGKTLLGLAMVGAGLAMAARAGRGNGGH
jgi:NAD(P)-dependent dehydrogenase (short-subunit alcohol dehydrogenase family)